jgi:hypothetical protein
MLSSACVVPAFEEFRVSIYFDLIHPKFPFSSEGDEPSNIQQVTIPSQSTHSVDVYAFEFRRGLCLFLDNYEICDLKSDDLVVRASEVRRAGKPSPLYSPPSQSKCTMVMRMQLVPF